MCDFFGTADSVDDYAAYVISYIGMIVLVYVLVSVVSLLGIKGGFAEHEVK